MSAGMVTPGGVVADVGCDHAHTSIFLSEKGIAKRCIGMDVRPGPLGKAKENLELYRVSDRIELRLSDGLSALTPAEADTIIIAGMGGELICDILTRGLFVALAAKELILQPQSHIYEVRLFLVTHGFDIVQECMCEEEAKFYVAMRAVPKAAGPNERMQKDTGNVSTGNGREGMAETGCSRMELEFGPLLIKQKDPVLLEYLDIEARKTAWRLNKIAGSKNSSDSEAKRSYFTERHRMATECAELMRGNGGLHLDNIKVKIGGNVLEYAKGTTLREIANDCRGDYAHDLILGTIDGRLSELTKKLEKDCKAEFVTVADVPGMAAYTRGAIILMLRAFTRVFDAGQIRKICVEHSIGNAIYCSINASFKLDANYLADVKKEMRRLVDLDLPIRKSSVRTRDARATFARLGMYDKEKLFRFRRVSNTNIYNLDGYIDYFYGYMPDSTGIVKYFDLQLYDEGFLLMLPDRAKPESVAPFDDRPKFFKTQRDSNIWGQKIGIETVGDLNEAITKGNISDLILVQEANQEKKIGDIAEMIKARGDVKFVMIAGPSSSGKTTFSHRLSIQLRTLGYRPHPISLDNYFVDRDNTPRDAEGNFNFECLEALDIEGFNRDMTDLLQGKPVDMPTFNFKAGHREYKGDILQLGPEDILVIEGIHGLNDKLSYTLPKESKFKIYISALTQLNIDEHNRIPTTDGRLIRRMVRDARTRGTSAKNTIAMWGSVRRGEEENIFPFQEEADVMFNSALIYELSVLKQFAEPLLFGIPEDCPEYAEAKRLLKFLDYFLGVSSEEIPHNSIVREFVGGSVFPV